MAFSHRELKVFICGASLPVPHHSLGPNRNSSGTGFCWGLGSYFLAHPGTPCWMTCADYSSCPSSSPQQAQGQKSNWGRPKPWTLKEPHDVSVMPAGPNPLAECEEWKIADSGLCFSYWKLFLCPSTNDPDFSSIALLYSSNKRFSSWIQCIKISILLSLVGFLGLKFFSDITDTSENKMVLVLTTNQNIFNYLKLESQAEGPH